MEPEKLTRVTANAAEMNSDPVDLPSLQCGTCHRISNIGGLHYMIAEHGQPPWNLTMCTCDEEVPEDSPIP